MSAYFLQAEMIIFGDKIDASRLLVTEVGYKRTGTKREAGTNCPFRTDDHTL